MKKRKHSVMMDISFQSMLVLLFIAVLFLSYDHAHLAMNGIILCIATLMFMITYFTSLRTGLIMDIIFVFLWIAYAVYRAVSEGIIIEVNIYFWIFWPMGMIFAISGFIREYQMLDNENAALVRNAEKYTTIDELTQMNNLLGFERDAAVYMNISRRYHLEMELVLWRLTYQENLEQLLGKEDMLKAISIISDSIKGSLRKEDLVYLVDDKPYIWGTLLFSKPEAAQVVINHVQEGVLKTGLKDLVSHKHYSLEITGTVVPFDGSRLLPLEFMNYAKKCLWFKEEIPVIEPKKTEPVKTEAVEPKRTVPAKAEEDRKLRQEDIIRKERRNIQQYGRKKKNSGSSGNAVSVILDRLQGRGKGGFGTASGREGSRRKRR